MKAHGSKSVRHAQRPENITSNGFVQTPFTGPIRIDRPASGSVGAEAEAADLSPVRCWLGRYYIVLETLAVVVALFMLLRGTLLAVFADLRSLTSGQLASVLFVGLRFDLMVGLIVLLPLIMSLTLVTNRGACGAPSRVFVHLSLVITSFAMVFLCCAEFVFFDEFSSRLNYIAFEYLIYPTEVFGSIWQSYPVVPLFAGVCGVATVLYMVLRGCAGTLLQVSLPWPRRFALLAGSLSAIGGLWSTTDMRSIEVSSNRTANECAGNGLYNLMYYAWTSGFDYDHFYLTTDPSGAYARVRARIAPSGGQWHTDSPNPLDRTVSSPRPRRDHNVVLILEESLGSDFVGVLGDDQGLTPCFDRLTQQGILFDNWYATGNRTARALEATLASLPPIPTESILKRDHNDRVWTLPRVLAGRGYSRVFVSGGRGSFDGMRSFTMSNGFERFVERKDYPDPTFVNAWGACDEDIFHRAIEEFDELNRQGKPFFGLVLTVSNHPPYTFPDGRIELVRGPRGQVRGRLNGVKYSDWALGDFFDCARSHAFFDNTVFVVMGDHGARVYGAELFPIKSYRVPVLMILPGRERAATRCSTLASSLDVAPTVLGVLGGSYRSVFFGRDALNIDPASGYAVMQHNHDLALLESDSRLVVLGCPRTVRAYRMDRTTMSLTPDEQPDSERIADSISLYQAADQLYYDENYFPNVVAPQ
ncbi:MAG: sulfatase-like hydrolase/transferase [Planctomycetes bacterium]|nr:sulfatase-like hydrolase/transferase [Planctomycetota bacterium]